ncbi:MAG: 3-dehydroquinate synthase [Promethearchaeota archaeon]|nr:MAG: 3-dehydroquinate synthase [Candidatus Lokiarchaeota archaeon]
MDMKRIILDFTEKTEEFKELVQEAFNRDILNFLISTTTHDEFKDIERVKTISKQKDLKPDYLLFENKEQINEFLNTSTETQDIAFYKELTTKEDEAEIKQLSNITKINLLIVSASDWKIIPFENLIAEMYKKDTELIAEVESVEEAELMLKTLEIGVDGILFRPTNANQIIELKKLVGTSFTIELTRAEIKGIQKIPESDRVCVDTTSLLRPGEGMLIGSTAMGFALVHAEVFETQFVASRPFRVNAGDVSAYILVPQEDTESKEVYRTKYLSELKGGERVIVVNTKGRARIVSVGRVKIETRPMLRFEMVAEKDGQSVPINCVCQNAETIRLVDPEGDAVSVVNLEVGDKILVHLGPGATHFGTAIKENIIEK